MRLCLKYERLGRNLKIVKFTRLPLIGGGWYRNKLNDNLPSLKRSKSRKKAQENEEEIKRNLQTVNQIL